MPTFYFLNHVQIFIIQSYLSLPIIFLYSLRGYIGLLLITCKVSTYAQNNLVQSACRESIFFNWLVSGVPRQSCSDNPLSTHNVPILYIYSKQLCTSVKVQCKLAQLVSGLLVQHIEVSTVGTVHGSVNCGLFF